MTREEIEAKVKAKKEERKAKEARERGWMNFLCSAVFEDVCPHCGEDLQRKMINTDYGVQFRSVCVPCTIYYSWITKDEIRQYKWDGNEYK